MSQPPPEDRLLAPKQMESDLEQLVTVLERAWAYAQDKREHFGVDLKALLARYGSHASREWTRSQFLAVVRELLAAIRDGHAHAWIAGGASPFPSRRWPFRLVDTQEGCVVEDVAPELTATIAPGDRLLAVDGSRVESVLLEESLRVPASTDGMRRALSIRNLQWTEALSVRATLQAVDGPPRCVAFDTVIPAKGTTPAPRWIDWKRLQPTLGYLRIRSFAATGPTHDAFAEASHRRRKRMLGSQEAEIRRAFRELHSTSSLILDLRGNGGGTDLLGQAVASHLLPAGLVYFRLETHESPDLAALPEFAPPGILRMAEFVPSMALSILRDRFRRRTSEPDDGLPGLPVQLPRNRKLSRYTGRLIVIMDSMFDVRADARAWRADFSDAARAFRGLGYRETWGFGVLVTKISKLWMDTKPEEPRDACEAIARTSSFASFPSFGPFVMKCLSFCLSWRFCGNAVRAFVVSAFVGR